METGAKYLSTQSYCNCLTFNNNLIIIECDMSENCEKCSVKMGNSNMIRSKMPKPIIVQDNKIEKKRHVAIKKNYKDNETPIITQNIDVNKKNHSGMFNNNPEKMDITGTNENSRNISKYSKKQRRTNNKSHNKNANEIVIETNTLQEKITPKCNRIKCQHYLHGWEKKKYMKINRVIYEDISSEEDFSFLIDEKLDTLIKRTKERDKKVMETLMASKQRYSN